MPSTPPIENRLKSFEATLARHFLIILLGLGIAGVLSALLIVGVYGYYFRAHTLVDDPTRWNEMGGFIGGCLGPIFGFFSLIALILTLWLQASALKDAQDESKRVLGQQADAAAAQGALIRIQALAALMDHMRDAVERSERAFRKISAGGNEEAYELEMEMNTQTVMEAQQSLDNAHADFADVTAREKSGSPVPPQEITDKYNARMQAEIELLNSQEAVAESQGKLNDYRRIQQELGTLTEQKERYAQELQGLLDGIRTAASAA